MSSSLVEYAYQLCIMTVICEALCSRMLEAIHEQLECYQGQLLCLKIHCLFYR